MQIKTTLGCHNTPTRMTDMRPTMPSVDADVEQLKLRCRWWECKPSYKTEHRPAGDPAISCQFKRNESLRQKKKKKLECS